MKIAVILESALWELNEKKQGRILVGLPLLLVRELPYYLLMGCDDMPSHLMPSLWLVSA